MTIWILALLCVGLASYAGFARGVIRVAMSLVGILLGLLLAPVLGPLLSPVMRAMISNVLLADALAPLAVFLIISIGFMLGGGTIHNKVEVFFRYKTTDTKLLHFERLMARMGACLGLLNGTLYFYVLCTVFYVAGYLTTQITTEENTTWAARLINRVSADLNASGMQRAIVAIDPMPPAYYDAVDVAGHIFHNRLLMSRLSRYPYFLNLAEQPEFQEIAGDPQVSQLLQTESTAQQLLAEPKIKALLANATIIDGLKQLDVADLKVFIETGKSPKYEAVRILGRWSFDLATTVEQVRLAQPSITPKDMLELNRRLGVAFLEATFTAAPDGQVLVKAVPPAAATAPGQPTPPPGFAAAPKTVATGTWSEAGGTYSVTLTPADPSPLYQMLNASGKVRVLGDSLVLEAGGSVLGFSIDL